jgi:hypothetical protein
MGRMTRVKVQRWLSDGLVPHACAVAKLVFADCVVECLSVCCGLKRTCQVFRRDVVLSAAAVTLDDLGVECRSISA